MQSALVVLGLLLLQATIPAKKQAAQPPPQSGPPVKSYHVSAVEPIIISKFQMGGGFVIGSDGTARTCPNEKNVGVYIRDEKARGQDVFLSVPRSAPIISNGEHVLSIACLKIE